MVRADPASRVSATVARLKDPIGCTIVKRMLTIRDSQMGAMGDASPNKPVVQPCATDPHFIEFQLLDQDNKPVPGEPFQVRLPDQSIVTGTLDNDGKVRFDPIIAGQASIIFTGMDKKEWRPL